MRAVRGPRGSGPRARFRGPIRAPAPAVNLQQIERADDPRVSDYRSVRDDERREQRVFVAESRLPVLRLLAGRRFRTRSVLLTPTALEQMQESLEQLSGEVDVLLAAQPLLNRIVGYNLHRGCAAAAERPRAASCAGLLAELPPGPQLVVVLEGVANPENIGSVFRNALAFGASAVVLCGGCSDPLYRKSIRVSMAATLRVPFAQAPEFAQVAAALRGAGFRILALCTDAAATRLPAFASAAPARIALVLGSEAEGVSAEVRAAADLCLRIPMAAEVDSLNVAVASGIALHHFARNLV